MVQLKKLLVVLVLIGLSAIPPINVFADSFARPDSSPSVRWVNGIGSPPCSDIDTHFCVDEVIRDDSDYIQSIGLGRNSEDIQWLSLSDIADPLQSSGHVLRYTIREGNEGTNPVQFKIELYQGNTLIASFTDTVVPLTFTLYQKTLSNAQADSITNYNDLQLKLTASCGSLCANSPSARERVALSWVEFAVVTEVSPPTLTGILNVSPTSLQLFWTEPLDTSKVVTYVIERSVGGGGFTSVGVVPKGTTTFIDVGLLPDTTYTYRMYSTSVSGNSAYSNQLSKSTTIQQIPSDYSRPDSDPSLRWVDGIGIAPCTSLLTFNCVDESIRDDSDYIQTVGLGSSSSDTQYYTLSDVKAPTVPLTHILRYTLAKANEGTNPVGFSIQLRQGPAVIGTWTHADGTLPSTFTLYERILSPEQVSTITDYNSLELTLTATCDSSCGNNPSSREKVRVSWIEFEIVYPVVVTAIDLVGKASLVTWDVPLAGYPEKYIVQKSTDGQAFVNAFEVLSDPTNRKINPETKREFFYGLDTNVEKQSTYLYKIIPVKNQKTLYETTNTNQIVIPNEDVMEIVANGYLINTTNTLIPYGTPFVSWYDNLIPKLYSMLIMFLFPSAEAQISYYGDPLFTSGTNPKNEPHLIGLTPIPSPTSTNDCANILILHYKRNLQFGQDLNVFATILENQVTVKYQHNYNQISEFNDRVYQDYYVIPKEQQVPIDLQNLTVQLDINSSTEPNPANHRNIAIYKVEFLVPLEKSGC